MPLWKKEQKLKKREISRFDRYCLMMKVTEVFESSLTSGNVDNATLEAEGAPHCMCVVSCGVVH